MDEEGLATRAGFVRTSLGPRVLRADTAPLAWLAALGLLAAGIEPA
jgi:16S rRNA (uracil1498-N3)-methyltransferase